MSDKSESKKTASKKSSKVSKVDVSSIKTLKDAKKAANAAATKKDALKFSLRNNSSKDVGAYRAAKKDLARIMTKMTEINKLENQTK